MSQWAVFTEYQGNDVSSAGLLWNTTFKVSKHFKTALDLDYLYVRSDGEAFHYLYYTWRFYYQVIQNMRIGTFLSNKAMNLDAHYQTFYMLRAPAIGLELRRTLDPYW